MKTPQSLLKEIARIQHMERGKLCVMRTGPSGTYYNHQTWEQGRNVVRYVTPDKLPALRAAIKGYQHFLTLAEAYASLVIQQSRASRKSPKAALPPKITPKSKL